MQTKRKVPPLEPKAHTATDSNKHHVGTDLEAPVVWLLLKGGKEQKMGGGEKRTSEIFSLQLSCKPVETDEPRLGRST